MIVELAKRKWHCVGRLVALVMSAIGSIAGMAAGSPAQAETQFTPSVTLSERYNSNVWNTAENRIPRGKQYGDFVTRLGADFTILNKSRLGDTSVRAGVDGNAYAYNNDLNYASGNVRATSDLTDWAQEVLPGLKLRISDAFRYTPNQSAFPLGVTPQQGVTTQPEDIFSGGVQPARANTWTNSFTTQGEYSLSRAVSLRTNYTYSILRIGRVYVTEVAPSGALTYFNTTAHNVAMGPTYTFDGGDTLFLKYNYLTSNQENTTTSRELTFTSQSIQPEYETRFARDWTARISAGATMVEQASNRTFFSGSFSLTNEFDRQTDISIGVSRQTRPGYFGIVGGAYISNVASLHVSHAFSEVARLTVRGNYGYNESTPVKIVTVETFYGSASLDYKLTRDTMLSLSQSYGHFTITGITPYDQSITMLSVRTEWK